MFKNTVAKEVCCNSDNPFSEQLRIREISEYWNCSGLSLKQGTLQTSDLLKDTKLVFKIGLFFPKKITELRLGYLAQGSFNTYLFTNFPLCVTIP